MEKNFNLKVTKRDGRIENFKADKITNAIIKAMVKIGNEDYDEAYTITNGIMAYIYYNYEDGSTIDISDIERITETHLMNYDKKVAREYISYRGSRDSSRTRSSNLVKKITGLFNQSDDEITAENANKDSTKVYVQRDLLAGVVAKEITKDLYMIPARVQKARMDNLLHWHDEDYSPLFDMYNCMLIDYRTMFEKGFILGNAIIEPPKSFEVACTLLSQIIQGVASSQYGGQTINRMDEGLAKYVTISYFKHLNKNLFKLMSLYIENINENKERVQNQIERLLASIPAKSIAEYNDYITKNPGIPADISSIIRNYNSDYNAISELHSNVSPETSFMIADKLVKLSMIDIDKEVYDGMQCIEYQINTIYSTNGQTPFVTLNFGLGTSIESRLIQINMLKVRRLGIGKRHITPVFPKLIFTRCKGINFYPEDPNYDILELAEVVAAERMYPDILNYENVCKVCGGEVVYKDKEHRVVDIEKSTGFKAPMGCRSFLHRWTNPDTGKEEYDGRNNMGVISVNLVRIALEAREYSDEINLREEYFFSHLADVLDIAHEGLTYRAERLLNVKAKVSPILYGDSTVGAYGATGFSLHPDEKVGRIFTNHRASVSLGFVGLHETILALYNDVMFNNPELIEKGKAIMSYLDSTAKKWKSESTWAFSVYGTPAENLMNKFIGPDKRRFGEIEGITDKDWYTNSTHLDVQQEANGMEKLAFESNFVKYTPGGVTCMIDCNSLKNNPKALEALWNYGYEKTEIPYQSINVKEDRCFVPDCMYVGEHIPTDKGYRCPCCGNTDPTKQNVIRRISGYLTDASSRAINHSKKSEIDNRVVHY